MLVLRGRAAEFERDLPFGIFVDALDGAAERPSLASSELAQASVAEERYRWYRSVRCVLEELAAPRPVVLVLDDLHWADDASVELISYLLARPPRGPVMLALAIRPGQAPARLVGALDSAVAGGLAERIELRPLSDVDVDRLVGGEVDRSTRQRLHRESGGNPFYLEQLLRTLPVGAARPLLASAATSDLEIPASVRASISEELSGLAIPARTVVWAAAVLGDPFEPELVAETAGLSQSETLADLDDLLRTELIAATDVPRLFRFRHPIVRRTVYESSGGRMAARRPRPGGTGPGRPRRLRRGPGPPCGAVRQRRRRGRHRSPRGCG